MIKSKENGYICKTMAMRYLMKAFIKIKIAQKC